MTPQLLVADGDPSIRDALQDYLQSHGYGVQTSADAASTLAQLRALRPALLLLDFGLPGQRGLQLAQAIRGAGDDTPIILISGAYHGPQELEEARDQLQIYDLLPKPLDLAALLRTVRTRLADPRPGASGMANVTDPMDLLGAPTTAVESPRFSTASAHFGPRMAADMQGDLRNVSVAVLLAAAHHQRATGLLDLGDATGTHRRIYVRDGQPTFMQSNAAGEHVGRLLLRRGRINERDVARCSQLMQERQRTLQQALLELRLATEAELATAYRLLAGELLPRSLAMTEGHFTWQESDAFVGRVPEGRFEALPLLFDGLRRWVKPPQVAAFMRGRLDHLLTPRPALETLLPAFRRAFPGREFSWSELPRGTTPRGLARGATDLVSLMSQLHALLNTQLLFSEPLPPGQGVSSTGPLPPNLDEAAGELRARLEASRSRDFFQLLGVGRDAGPPAVERAYFQSMLSWPPALMAGLRDDADLRPHLAALDQRYDEAFQTLSDPTSRAAYLQYLARAGGTHPAALREFRLALARIERSEWNQAQRHLLSALEQEHAGAYFAALGWVVFRQDPRSPSHAAHAVRNLRKALELQPDLPDAQYYLGEIAAERGQTDEARKWWYRCLSADPAHRCALEALARLDGSRTQSTDIPR